MKLLLVLMFAAGAGSADQPIPYKLTIESIRPIKPDQCASELERWRKAVQDTHPGLSIKEELCVDDGLLTEPKQKRRRWSRRRHRR